jgi:cation-transporting ATPase E/undecaprenyl-diphosphatase
VLSGSFVAEGNGEYVVTAVGADSHAMRVAGEARAFRHPRSPLERALNRLLLVLVAIIVPLGLILGAALWERQTPLSEAVPTSVAAVVTLVPEGLILLASLTYAVASLRMSRRGALAQQLNAIESIASVDVVCLDKTGTLTQPRLRVLELVPADGVAEEELATAAGRYAASAPARNATLDAIAAAYPADGEQPDALVPFSSRRRFGALALDGDSYVLGAPELFPLGTLEERSDAAAGDGRRVVALGRTRSTLDADDDGAPDDLTPLGLIVIAEELRPQASETVEFLRAQGVELKVLSGDRPRTVAAIAADAGLPAAQVVDGRDLPEDATALRRVALESSVIGRISPEGKKRVVEALRDAGKYVAMVGDGVNDVPALKSARLAIAQGSGTEMARSVADLVLVDGDFGAVPQMVGEGRTILRNLQRVAKLFVTKSAFAAVLILSVGLTPTAYPLLPRHLTLAAALTIGIPAFFLALAPSVGRFRVEGFLFDVARFAWPAGVAAALGVISSYLFALNVADWGLLQARTVATTVLIVVGLYLVVALEASAPRRGAAVSMLAGALLGLYVLVLVTPAARDFFELAVPSFGGVIASIVGAALAIGSLILTSDRFVPGRGAAP